MSRSKHTEAQIIAALKQVEAATIKYRIFGHPRLLMRGLTGARAEIGIATMAYNLKRITNVLGAAKLTKELLHAR